MRLCFRAGFEAVGGASAAAAAGALAAGDGRGRRFPIGGVTLFLPFDADARGVFDFGFFAGGCIGDAATGAPAHQQTNGVGVGVLQHVRSLEAARTDKTAVR